MLLPSLRSHRPLPLLPARWVKWVQSGDQEDLTIAFYCYMTPGYSDKSVLVTLSNAVTQRSFNSHATIMPCSCHSHATVITVTSQSSQSHHYNVTDITVITVASQSSQLHHSSVTAASHLQLFRSFALTLKFLMPLFSTSGNEERTLQKKYVGSKSLLRY